MKTLVLFQIDPSSAGQVTQVDPSAQILTATDLAATRGDGIFETIMIRSGVPQAMEPHLDRFARSAAMLDLPEPDRELWRSVVLDAARQMQDHPIAAVKYILSRGDEVTGQATGWALGFVPDSRPAGDSPEIDVVVLDRGYRSDVAQTSPWLLQGAKTLSYAVNMAALREAKRRGADDVVFVSTDGFVLEGPNATLIARIDDVYTTTPTEFGILPSTTQGDVIAALAQAGEQVEVRALRTEDLQRADALWLCSSTRGAAPIRSLDGAPVIVDHEASARMLAALDAREA
ncbi:MAG: aminodeoxychorismate lyase [Microbacterium sp.]